MYFHRDSLHVLIQPAIKLSTFCIQVPGVQIQTSFRLLFKRGEYLVLFVGFLFYCFIFLSQRLILLSNK